MPCRRQQQHPLSIHEHVQTIFSSRVCPDSLVVSAAAVATAAAVDTQCPLHQLHHLLPPRQGWDESMIRKYLIVVQLIRSVRINPQALFSALQPRYAQLRRVERAKNVLSTTYGILVLSCSLARGDRRATVVSRPVQVVHESSRGHDFISEVTDLRFLGVFLSYIRRNLLTSRLGHFYLFFVAAISLARAGVFSSKHVVPSFRGLVEISRARQCSCRG